MELNLLIFWSLLGLKKLAPEQSVLFSSWIAVPGGKSGH